MLHSKKEKKGALSSTSDEVHTLVLSQVPILWLWKSRPPNSWGELLSLESREKFLQTLMGKGVGSFSFLTMRGFHFSLATAEGGKTLCYPLEKGDIFFSWGKAFLLISSQGLISFHLRWLE